MSLCEEDVKYTQKRWETKTLKRFFFVEKSSYILLSTLDLSYHLNQKLAYTQREQFSIVNSIFNPNKTLLHQSTLYTLIKAYPEHQIDFTEMVYYITNCYTYI